MAMWKVTAGRGNAYVGEFVGRDVAAIGWSELGDQTGVQDKAALLAAFRTTYPDDTLRQSEVGAGQVWRFLREMRLGDDIVTYDPTTRLYHLGTIEGPPIHDASWSDPLRTRRAVRWRTTRPRDDLSAPTRNGLGAIMTLFKLSDAAADELRGTPQVVATPLAAPVLDTAVPDEVDPFENIADQALERTKDRISRLGWDEMQELVAALLRALGYRTIVSPAGPDRGKDIVASRDGFGFERPRIVVEVKHRRGQMGAQEIRSFLGGRHTDDRGLYVSTGGFTREAYYEAERASTLTHLMTLDDLARAVIEQYEQIDERGRRLLPLTRLYWPA